MRKNLALISSNWISCNFSSDCVLGCADFGLQLEIGSVRVHRCYSSCWLIRFHCSPLARVLQKKVCPENDIAHIFLSHDHDYHRSLNATVL